MKSIILTEKEVQKVLKSGKLKLRKKCSQPVGTIFYVKEGSLQGQVVGDL